MFLRPLPTCHVSSPDPGASLPGPVHAVALQTRRQDQPGPQAQVHPHLGVCSQRGGDLEEGAVRDASDPPPLSDCLGILAARNQEPVQCQKCLF